MPYRLCSLGYFKANRMPLTTSNNQAYRLNLHPQKRNVFVTQLNEPNDDDDDIRRYAVVKESADELLKTGVNTLQKTSLLRKAVEMEEIDRDLKKKREEFHLRMKRNKEREEALKKRQEETKERVVKFDRFLKENESKRSRALRRYQLEVKDNKVQERNLERVQEEVRKMAERKMLVLRKLQEHKKYEDFLMRVVDIVPDDYVEMTGENMVESLITRHEGLSCTQTDLENRNHDVAATIEKGQRRLDKLRHESVKQKLLINSQMADLQAHKEKVTQRVNKYEQEVVDTSVVQRGNLLELGRLSMAIDNLAETCRARHWPPATDMDYPLKLTMIKQCFEEQEMVYDLVIKLRESRSSAGSIRKQDLPKSGSFERSEKSGDSFVTSLPPINLPRQKSRPKLSGIVEQLTTIKESERH